MNSISTQSKQSFMSRSWFHLIAIVLVSTLLILPILTSSCLKGHDIRYHFEIIRSLDVAFDNGYFTSKFMDLICQDYGYGTGLFYSTIPASIAVIIMNIFNCSSFTAVGIELILLFTLSGIAFYYFAKSIFKKNSLALISAILYLTTPYVLHEVYTRFAFSEMFLMLSTPMIAWGIYELINNKNYKKFYFLFTIGYVISFLLHFTLTIFITIFVAIYICCYFKSFFKDKLYIPFIISVIIILLITATYYVPMLINYPNMAIGEMSYSPNFLYFNGFWSFFYLWLTFTTIINITTIVVFTKKLNRNRGQNSKSSKVLFSLLISTFVLSTSIFPWFLMPDFVGMIQYVWRFFMANATVLVLSIVYLLSKVEIKKHRVALTIITALVSLISLINNFSSSYSSAVAKNKINESSYTTYINGKSENHGLGANKKGDYYPKGATQDYIFTRANASMVLDTNLDITEFANYQSINQISFIINQRANPYVVLNIPYDVCEGASCYQFTDNSENKRLNLSVSSENINGVDYLRLDLTKTDCDSKVTITYEENSSLDKYLKTNPFEFITLEGEASFTNFVKENSNTYSVEIIANDTTIIELPTLYYKGYNIKLVTDSAVENIEAKFGTNGFIEVEINTSGTLYVEFEGKYIDYANYISLAGVVVFVSCGIVILIKGRKKKLAVNS